VLHPIQDSQQFKMYSGRPMHMETGDKEAYRETSERWQANTDRRLLYMSYEDASDELASLGAGMDNAGLELCI